jgi:hypothetical protein
MRQMVGQTDGTAEGWMRQMDGQTDRIAKGWTDSYPENLSFRQTG